MGGRDVLPDLMILGIMVAAIVVCYGTRRTQLNSSPQSHCDSEVLQQLSIPDDVACRTLSLLLLGRFVPFSPAVSPC